MLSLRMFVMTPRGRLLKTQPIGLLLTLLAFGGCLNATPARTPSANDLLQLQAAVDALDQRQTKGLEHQEAVAKRLEHLELERSTAARETQELASRLGTLTTELGALARETERLATRVDQTATATAGRMDVVNGELQALGERLTTISRDLQELTTRLSAAPPVEQPPLPAPAATPTTEAGAPAATPSPQGATPLPSPVPIPAPAPTQSGEPTPDTRAATAVDPQGLYNAGYTDYGRGNYALAIGAFREFIRRYPTDEMAGNAQYWIAEAYLGLAHRYVNGAETERASAAFTQAIEAFQAVGQRYPRGDKAPAALFREAGIHFELGQTDRARARLEYLVEHFPTAPEARLARQRLAESAKP
jgi:tol-pal system protein YbgF